MAVTTGEERMYRTIRKDNTILYDSNRYTRRINPCRRLHVLRILFALDTFDQKWSKKYPKITVSWRSNWANLATYFMYPKEVRTLIYTINSIEGFNCQLRKVTNNKGIFPNDDSLFKMIYLAMIDITKKWTGRRKDWEQIHSQLEIFFADRLL